VLIRSDTSNRNQHHAKSGKPLPYQFEQSVTAAGFNVPHCVQRIPELNEDSGGAKDQRDYAQYGRKHPGGGLLRGFQNSAHRVRTIGSHRVLHLSDDFLLRRRMAEHQSDQQDCEDHHRCQRENRIERHGRAQPHRIVIAPG
jgi:hypothetical protein